MYMYMQTKAVQRMSKSIYAIQLSYPLFLVLIATLELQPSSSSTLTR